MRAPVISALSGLAGLAAGIPEVTTAARVGDGLLVPTDAREALTAYRDRLDARPTWLKLLHAGITIGAIYHGYKRNDSALWAVLWGLFAGGLPFLAAPIALAQGFGKRGR